MCRFTGFPCRRAGLLCCRTGLSRYSTGFLYGFTGSLCRWMGFLCGCTGFLCACAGFLVSYMGGPVCPPSIFVRGLRALTLCGCLFEIGGCARAARPRALRVFVRNWWLCEGCAPSRSAGRGPRRPLPTPASGLAPRTPNLMWPASAALVCHASVVPKSWQRKSKEFQFWKCFKLALLESYDAGGEHHGGMTVRHFAS